MTLHPQACSTPFGITDQIGSPAARYARGRGDVLNAFRHHGSYRIGQQVDAFLGTVCSTPFGITDHIGWSSASALPWPRGAQRLSASRIISGLNKQLGFAAEMCSTPFGITDHIGGQLPAGGGAHVDRCSTPFGITDHIGAERLRLENASMIVLNAFRHHGSYRR